ncbi:MAG TPA: hypothetical protein VN833_05605 [Candidatus Acidoferrales bacterium]|nr:hypothetical protein [Candidatus Acidoferrales bacterium]
MNPHLLDPMFIMLAGVVVLVIAVLAWLFLQKRRSTTAGLRQKFGPEYERAVQKHGSERKAEVKLANRQDRVEKLNIRDLDPVERERFSTQWESVQSRFVDSPRGAVAEADDLVSSLMKTRGYPVSDFDQRADDISVDHPRVVENYRSAHHIALQVGTNGASTEDLRTAMIHYRSLFEELVQVPTIAETKEVA